MKRALVLLLALAACRRGEAPRPAAVNPYESKLQPLLSKHNVTEILNVSMKTVDRLIDSGHGELRAIRIGGVWRIDQRSNDSTRDAADSLTRYCPGFDWNFCRSSCSDRAPP